MKRTAVATLLMLVALTAGHSPLAASGGEFGFQSQSQRDVVRVIVPKTPQFSSLCRSKTVAGERFSRPLGNLRRALRYNKTVKVLAIGSSSTVGVGASRPSAAYIARLETDLEGALANVDVEVIGKGISGEVAQGTADRMRANVLETRPDLVVWQLGTNDAIRHVDIDAFRRCVRTTLDWLKEQRIDVVLIDPQYGDKLAQDEFYGKIVNAVAETARDAKVLLVDRYQSMRELSRERGDATYLASDQLHLNDNGHRCMAEQLARAIVTGIVQDDVQDWQGQ